MKKGLRALFLLVLILGLVAAGAASLWLGRGVKLAVERFGPGIVGAPVTVGAVVLAPFSGVGTITNLEIGNPPGFKGPYALRVGSIEVKIKLATLARETVVVERVVIKEPRINYELGPGGSNLARLQKNAEGGKGKPAASQGGKSLEIGLLSVTGGQVGLSAAALGSATVALPDVRLSNLGGKGRSPADAAAEVLSAISGGAAKAVSNLGGKALETAASEVLGRLGGMLKGKK
ncbi:MAG: hypothetical protein M0D55_07390 [Elusimicrobiota bacterium]|nr:MAG: hypothetical protein M0D55_07390 [Elusimicrobiota bacterium]